MRNARRRVRQDRAVEDTGGQDGLDELQDPPVADPFPQTLQDEITIEPVEKLSMSASTTHVLPARTASRMACSASWKSHRAGSDSASEGVVVAMIGVDNTTRRSEGPLLRSCLF